jgi:hypothetical protein
MGGVKSEREDQPGCPWMQHAGLLSVSPFFNLNEDKYTSLRMRKD